MKILYITNEVNSPINRNLCKAIVQYDTTMSVTLLSINTSAKDVQGELQQKYNLKEINVNSDYNYYYQKYNFFYKRKQKLRLVEKTINIHQYDLIFASTLFSDGIVAYDIFKKYNIPYISAIRGTDVNFYFSKMFHLWILGRKIINKASKIICISESLKNNLQKKIPYKILIRHRKELFVVPNGIDDIWIDNYRTVQNKNLKRFLYIGHLDRNKNIRLMINAFIEATKIANNITLTIIGSGGEYEDYVNKISNKYDNIFYLGSIYDKTKLLNIVRDNDAFIMVSHSETFGLVYLECLSQGLPIIYSQNQGIDGLFPNLKLGYAVNSDNLIEIKKAIIKISSSYINDFDQISELIKEFRWTEVGKKICNIIKSSQHENS